MLKKIEKINIIEAWGRNSRTHSSGCIIIWKKNDYRRWRKSVFNFVA